MNRCLLLFILCTILVSGCNNNSYDKRLVEVDSLLSRNATDSVEVVLSSIDPSVLSPNDIMYYNLISFEYILRLGREISEEDNLGKMEKYFREREEEDKVARTLYCQSVAFFNENSNTDAVLALKKAELIANKLDDDELLYKVNAMLAFINNNTSNYKEALAYAHKALNNAKKDGKKYRIGHALNQISVIYDCMHIKDSSDHYTESTIPYIKYMPSKDQTSILNNISIYYSRQGDKKTAESFLLRSLEIEKEAWTYGLLAQLYSDTGRDDMAKDLWARAMTTDNLRVNISFVKSYSKWLKRNGYTDAAYKTALKVLEMKDSLTALQNTETVKHIQTTFDKTENKNKTLHIALYVLGFISVLFVIIISGHIRHRRKIMEAKKALVDRQHSIDNYSEQVRRMEEDNEKKEKNIRRMENKVTDMRDKHSEILLNGRKLYDSITNGGTIIKWRKQEQNDFVEYYCVQKKDFSETFTHYESNLPSTLKMIVILYDMGMDNNNIKRIMNMSDGALRTARYRIKKRMRNKQIVECDE